MWTKIPKQLKNVILKDLSLTKKNYNSYQPFLSLVILNIIWVGGR